MDKFAQVTQVLRREGLVGEEGFAQPRAAPAEWMRLVHEAAYVEQVFAADVPPDIVRLIGLPLNESVVIRSRCAVGGTVLSAYLALEHGLACNTAGGSHHARRSRGAGFCVFNDVAVAIRVLQADGVIHRAMVIDLDAHQGDGTADIFSEDSSVFTFSMHCENDYPEEKIPSDLDIGLADGATDGTYLEELRSVLPDLLSRFQPDIVFYNAGVDPHMEDQLGGLSLSDQGLEARDLFVISTVRAAKIPLVGVLGGGYMRDIDRLAYRHAGLHRAAFKVWSTGGGAEGRSFSAL